MYKITLYDQNCSPICDGTVSWYVENLEEFEEKWLPLQSKLGVETIKRDYRSKLGEIVTDYYSDSEELNIVQQVDAKVLEEKDFYYYNKSVEYTKRGINWEDYDKQDRYKDFYTNEGDFYKHEKVETFVWLPIKRLSEDEKIRPLTKEEISRLLRDIVGEAG